MARRGLRSLVAPAAALVLLLLPHAAAAAGSAGGADLDPLPAWITVACPGTACTVTVANPVGNADQSWISVRVPASRRMSHLAVDVGQAGGCDRPEFGPRAPNASACFLARKGTLCSGCELFANEPAFDLAPGERWQAAVAGGARVRATFTVDKPLRGDPVVICFGRIISAGGAACWQGEAGTPPNDLRVAAVDAAFDLRLAGRQRSTARERESVRSTLAALDTRLRATKAELDEAYAGYTAAGRDIRALATALRALDAVARAERAGSATRAAVEGQIAAVTAAVAAQERRERRARSAYAAAETAFLDLEAKRAEAERRLDDLARELAPLDFGLLGVDIMVGGLPVHSVDLRTSFPELEEVRARLAELDRRLPQLRDQKAAAFADFVAARDHTIDLLGRLGGATGKIMQVAIAKAGVSAAFHLGDFAKAWFLEGGPVGVFKEVVKKAAEAGAKALIDTEAVVGPAGTRGDAAVQDAWIREALEDTFEKGSVKATLFERSYREAALSPGLEQAEELLAHLRQPLGRRSVGAVDASLLWKDAVVGTEARMARIAARYERMRELQSTLRLRVARGAGIGAGVGLELLKDFAESAFHNVLDGHERALWLETATADQAARLWFAVYQAAARAYYEAVDARDDLRRLEQRLLLGWDPQKGQRVTLRKQFAPGEVRIALRVEWPGAPRRVPLQVEVNGVVAKQLRPAEWSVSREALREALGEGRELRIALR